MTSVYFLCVQDEPDLIKVGVSNSPRTRARQIASEVNKPIQILAAFSGTKKEEAHIHKMLADFRSDGEWFLANRTLDELIKIHSGHDDVGLFTGMVRSSPTVSTTSYGREQDAQIAQGLIKDIISDLAPETSINNALEIAFKRLTSQSSNWTRRRVKALWNLEAHKVEYHEIMKLSACVESESPRGLNPKNGSAK